MYFIMLCLYIISLTTIMEQVREVSDLPLLTMDEHTRKTRCQLDFRFVCENHILHEPARKRPMLGGVYTCQGWCNMLFV